ncbi:unnamed protein product [Ectocarpus sp. 8 AP-2014]
MMKPSRRELSEKTPRFIYASSSSCRSRALKIGPDRVLSCVIYGTYHIHTYIHTCLPVFLRKYFQA